LLTWFANIYSIIAYASRAFALYYALQCAIAMVFAARSRNGTDGRGRYRVVLFGVLTLLALLVVALGRSSE